VPLGGASIAIVTVSSHRQAAFEAARYAIDETKARVPIWKAEQFADGHVWIGEPPRAGPPPAPPADPPPADAAPAGPPLAVPADLPPADPPPADLPPADPPLAHLAGPPPVTLRTIVD
jgi:hypothetical protein